MTIAQDAAYLYMRGLAFPRIGRALGITERQAIDATMAMLDMVHCKLRPADPALPRIVRSVPARDKGERRRMRGPAVRRTTTH